MLNTSEIISVGDKKVSNIVENGVRQGCPLGPGLFLVVLAALMKEIKNEFPGAMAFAYADDLTYMDSDKKKLEEIVVFIKKNGRKYGLVVNEDKTEFISVEKGKFTKESKLLGTWIGNASEVLEFNIKKAKRSFFAFYNGVWRSSISLKYKISIFNSFCVSTLLYGLDSEALSQKQLELLDSFAFQCYKKMIGIFYAKDGNVSKKRVYDTILQVVPNFETVSEVLRLKRLKTWDHMLRKEKKLKQKIINYRPPTAGCKFIGSVCTLSKLIPKDRALRPDYIPREC
jgi:predicted DNA-binding protein YlxM (UPF0122 family)